MRQWGVIALLAGLLLALTGCTSTMSESDKRNIPGPIGLEQFTTAVIQQAQVASGRPDYQGTTTLTNAWQVKDNLNVAAGHFEHGAGLLIHLESKGRVEMVGIGVQGAPGPARIVGVKDDLVIIAQGSGHVTYNHGTGEVSRSDEYGAPRS